MKFSNLKVNETTIIQYASTLPQRVESIEDIKGNKQAVLRVKLKGLAPYAFLIKKDDSYRAVHWCEANEKGSSCSHIATLAAILSFINENLEKVSVKTKLDDLNDTPPFNLDDSHWKNINKEFGLMEVVKPSTAASTSSMPGDSEKSPTAASPMKKTGKRDWKEEWNEVQDYLESEEVSIALQNKIQQRRIEVFDYVSVDPMMIAPTKPSFPYHGPMLQRAIRHILNKKDLILIGGKGTGKDTLIATIGWILGLPTSIHVGNKDETKESIVGEPAFRDGKSTFDLSQFAKTVENGGIANLAEINMLLGDVTSIYHSLLDDNGVLSSPVGAIKRHEHFLMIGSMNVGDGYAGIRELNDAFKDRFAIIRMPYTADFQTMLTQKTGLHDRHCLSFLEKIKKAIERMNSEEQQGHAANTLRGYIDAARYFMEYGINPDTKAEVIEDYIINKIEDTDEYMAARDMIRQEGWKDFPISTDEDEYMKGAL
jgi:hypothetical protein